MTGEAATIIERLIDAAEFAAEVLDDYSDVDDGDDGVPVANKAMLAYMELNAVLTIIRRNRQEQNKDVAV